jgi:class 3 adenylate cyclase
MRFVEGYHRANPASAVMDGEPSPRFSLALLGGFELTGPQGVVDLPSGKLAGLLAYLACTAPKPQPRERLSALLWGSHFDAQAKQNLRQALARLRKVLGPNALESDGEVAWLNPTTVLSDVGRFESLIREGGRDSLNAAADLYQGRLLDDVALSEEGWNEWLTGERERLLELALGGLVRLGEQELAAGRAEQALKAGRRAVALNNMREDAHRLIVQALVAVGRKAEALRHYQDLVSLLKRALNTEPDAATKSLVAELRTAQPAAKSPAVEIAEPASVEKPAAGGSSERRQLTIMACNLVDSTALSARLDPEDMRDLIGSFHKAVADVASRFDGFVGQYLGDGALVYFGYPAAREHDTEQAVRAGLAILDTTGTLKAASGGPLQARVGIATGLVVVGEQLGTDDTRQRVAIGETPDLAARLQAMAAPGEVLIAASTHRLVGRTFDCRAREPIEVKGLPQPVQAWQVRGEAAGVSRFEARRSGELSTFVGRREEMELLLRRWEQARRGEGRVVLLSGEPGIGKSRIAESLLASLVGEPHVRLRYFCSPHHSNSPLYPFIDQLERAAGFEAGSTATAKLDRLQALLEPTARNLPRDLALVADLLSVPTDGRYPALSGSPQQKREMILTALLDQLEGAAARGPVLIVFEDAHWIDPTSQDLLDRMVARVANLPVLLVVTGRPELHPAWVGETQVTMLSLSRLGRGDSAGIIAGVAKGKALPEALLERVLAATDGVPLFVEELTATLLESGLLRETADSYVLDRPLPPLAIPTTLQASLVARLDRLGAGKDVAVIGAAIGRDFSHELIAAISALAPADLDAAFERLAASRLVSRRGTPPDATYSFKHALVRDAAYATMLRSRRRELHSSIAKVLVEGFPALAERQPEVVAQHYTEAGLALEAIGYWVKAGRLAYPRAANREAAEFFEQALHLLDALPEIRETLEQGIDIRMDLGNALFPLLERPRMGEHLHQAEVLARRLGDQIRLARVAAWLTNQRLAVGAYDEAFSFAQEALTIARALGDGSLGMVATCHVVSVHLMKGELSEAASLIERTDVPAGVGLKPGDVVITPAFLKLLFADVLCQLGRFDEAFGHAEVALQIAEAADHPVTLGFALFELGRAHLRRGDLPRATRVLERCLDFRRTRQLEAGKPHTAATLGVAYALAGRADEALPLVAEAVEEFRRRPRYTRPAIDLLCAGMTGLSAGRIDEAAGHAREALDLSRRLGARASEAESLCLCGDVASARGDEEASGYYREALALAEEIGMRPLIAHCHLGLGKLYRRDGKREQAQEHLTTATAMYRDMGMTYWLEQAEEVRRQLQ